jgi:hypothetical protein
LIKSDIYSLEHGQLVINPNRMFETTPVIKLGDHFKKVRYLYGCPFTVSFLTLSYAIQIQQFQKRFKKIPKIIELDHLTVTGDVYFGRNVTLRGIVIIVANEGHRIDIPEGSILENRMLCGNMTMIVRLLGLHFFFSPNTLATSCRAGAIIVLRSAFSQELNTSWERGHTIETHRLGLFKLFFFSPAHVWITYCTFNLHRSLFRDFVNAL